MSVIREILYGHPVHERITDMDVGKRITLKWIRRNSI
jgi:hypothetical protein